MSGSFVDRLRSLVPPPADGPFNADVDVAACVPRIAVVDLLPTDYIELVKLYGPGAFDGSLHVLQPSSSNPHLDLAVQLTAHLEALRQLSGRPTLPVTLPIAGPDQTQVDEAPYKITRSDPGIIDVRAFPADVPSAAPTFTEDVTDTTQQGG